MEAGAPEEESVTLADCLLRASFLFTRACISIYWEDCFFTGWLKANICMLYSDQGEDSV